MKKANHLLIIGPLPPPYGGVSIHIKRLSLLIENDFEIDYIDESRNSKSDYFNIRSFNLILYTKKIIKADLIYIHSGTSLLQIFHIISGKIFAKKIILTVHAYPFLKNKIQKSVDGFFFSLADKVIFVSLDILRPLALAGEKYIVKHAFLPPIIEMESDLPKDVIDWIQKKKENGKLIACANAVRLDIYENMDLYGLDICIQVASSLTRERLPISFVFIVSSLEKNKDLFYKYKERINELGLNENFLLKNVELSFVKLIEQSDIVLRPTNTDGDALTVREALYYGKPIIASDIVNRPAGTTLFKSRDVNDLELKIKETIKLMHNTPTLPINECRNIYHIFYKDLIDRTLKHK